MRRLWSREPHSGHRRAERAQQMLPSSQGLGVGSQRHQGRGLGWILVVPVLAASIHAQTGPTAPTAPVATEFRVFNGTEEITASTRVRIVPAGKRDAQAIEAQRPVTWLAPAMYDVQAIRGGGVASIKWAERLAVVHYPDEGGRHLEVINFQPRYGALQLRAAQGPLAASDVTLFRAGTRTAAPGRVVAGEHYVLFVALAGRYDIRVQHMEPDGGGDTHWILAVDVPPGRTRLKVIGAP